MFLVRYITLYTKHVSEDLLRMSSVEELLHLKYRLRNLFYYIHKTRTRKDCGKAKVMCVLDF